MLQRKRLSGEIIKAINRSPITAILGPRQCGKTTISQIIATDYNSHFFDLEDPIDLERLSSAAKITLEPLKGIIIIDEIQRMPELFPLLRVLADKNEPEVKYLILGSASPQLIKDASESLSGRISFIDMSGFTLDEINEQEIDQLWFRGGFPRSFLSEDDNSSYNWRNDFIRTFLERDLPQLGINIPSTALRRFWTMLAHYHGQIWNGSEFARSLSVSEPTSRNYLDILSSAYVVRQIQPWFENLKKRQVKSPKIFIRDSGILHALLTLQGSKILSHPKLGASWEGFVIEQLITLTGSRDYYYWATYTGAELDFLIFKNGKRLGFEIKYTDAPKITKSMRISFNELKLDQLYIIYPGDRSFTVAENIDVVSINELEPLCISI